MKKVFAIVGMGILIFGCQGPKVQKAIESLSAQADSLAGEIGKAEPILTVIADLEKKMEAKMTVEEEAAFIGEIDKTKASISAATAIKSSVTAIRDSVAILEEKANEKAKEGIVVLNAKLDEVFGKVSELSNGSRRLDEIKMKLEEKKKEAEKKGAKKGAVKAEKKKAVAPPATKK
jgi:hypothetical protein